MSKNCLQSPKLYRPLKIRVYADTKQGGRDYMEDFVRIKLADVSSPAGEVAYLGVFDGHGGPEAARLAQSTLGAEISRLMGAWTDDSDSTVIKAVKQAFLNTHRLMNKFVGMWPKTISGLPSTAGTTASVVLIRGDKLYVAHVGDSAVVLGKRSSQTCSDEFKSTSSNVNSNWVAESLTTDHKPECPTERRRIEESGGEVMSKAGIHRVVWYRPRNARASNRLSTTTVQGVGGPCPVDTVPFLAVARALGDLWSYNRERDVYVVSPEPDVSVHCLDRSVHKCVILASDGVWNMVSAAESVELVQNCVRQYEQLESRLTSPGLNQLAASTIYERVKHPAAKLVSLALQRWSSKRLRADNTSAIVVVFETEDNNACPFHPDALTEYLSDPCDTSDVNMYISPPPPSPSRSSPSSIPFCQQLADLNVQSRAWTTRGTCDRGVGEEKVTNAENGECKSVASVGGEGRSSGCSSSSASNSLVSLAELSTDSVVGGAGNVERMNVLCERKQIDIGGKNCRLLGNAAVVSLSGPVESTHHSDRESLTAINRAAVTDRQVQAECPRDCVSDDTHAVVSEDCAFPGCDSDGIPLNDVEDQGMIISRASNDEPSKCVSEPSMTSQFVSSQTLFSYDVIVASKECSNDKLSVMIDVDGVKSSELPCDEAKALQVSGVDTRVNVDAFPNRARLPADVSADLCSVGRLSNGHKRKGGKQTTKMEKRMMHAVCSSMHVKRHLTRLHIDQIRVEQS